MVVEGKDRDEEEGWFRRGRFAVKKDGRGGKGSRWKIGIVEEEKAQQLRMFKAGLESRRAFKVLGLTGLELCRNLSITSYSSSQRFKPLKQLCLLYVTSRVMTAIRQR